MSDVNLPSDHSPSHPIRLVTPATWGALVPDLSPTARACARLAKFAGKAGEMVIVPDDEGAVASVLFGLGDGPHSPMALRTLAGKAPPGDYHIDGELTVSADAAAVAWALGTYQFDRYKRERSASRPRLVTPAGGDLARIRAQAHACALARDMVNTPANDLGPLQIETIARELAQLHAANLSVITGEALIAAGYPAIHAVGRAAAPERAPRMIEMTWGVEGRPVLAIVGKGVAFDTGGLDIKPSAGMRWMKKDMGGAAHALALGRMIMAADLPVRIHVLLPVVENAISGEAMRPGDVLASRQGLSIEVGNTDAEGRLILADALTRAAELGPALTIDMATLTGAARVALGPQVIPFYTDDDDLAADLAAAAQVEDDPLWRMPLWEGYAAALESDVADLKNDPDGWAQAGSVTAALFLKRFAPPGPWVHLDIFAWNPRGRPGWSVGAEAQAIRALFAMIERRYPKA
jgi:leucyl aminopeptidase